MTARAAEFAAAKLRQGELEAFERRAAAELRGIAGVGSGSMGLTPDSVKASPEYRAARAAHDSAFRQLQQFNATFCRTFKAELRDERKRRHADAPAVQVDGDRAEIWL